MILAAILGGVIGAVLVSIALVTLLAFSERAFRFFGDRVIVRYLRREPAQPPLDDRYWY
jgi:hypothetical protein